MKKVIILILIIALFAFSSYPSFLRLPEPLINTSQTGEMKVSKYIYNNYPSTIIYTNHNYPVFAYYTQNKIIKLENQNDLFYKTYKTKMDENGILIVYNDTYKEPSIQWLGNASEFTYLNNMDNIYIYNYSIN